MNITVQLVVSMAKLSRIVLTDDEKHAYARELTDILHYINKLEQVDTEGVEPTACENLLKAIDDK